MEKSMINLAKVISHASQKWLILWH